MADRNNSTNSNPNAAAPAPAAGTVAKTIWMKQAEEAKLKSEAEKAAAAKAAFEATFKNSSNNTAAVAGSEDDDDDDDDDEDEEEKERRRLALKPIGPVDPGKCTAAGAGIAGGTACVGSTFVVVTKDADGRKLPHGGAQVKVRVSPGVGVGGTEQEGIVKDMGDGTYTVTYVVPKRGNYMVNVECNGKAIMGSPFPLFFSSGPTTGGLLGVAPSSTYPNMVNQTMPNMPNYSGSVSGAFPGLLGMIPGIVQGASGGVVLPGIGASLGEVCREYLNGRCAKTDCKFSHPPHNLLMTALAATTSMGTVSQVPMAPSAAAMAAAQAIVAAQALQAHAAQAAQAQAQSAKDNSGSADKEGKNDTLKRTVQVSNLSPLLTVDQLKQLFGLYGTVVECNVTDSKYFAYIEYSKPEEATAALGLNNMDVAGRPLNVEMAKSLPPKSAILGSSSLPLMMQQAVAMQQMQFQQALLMQQTLTQQQAANRAASMKTATELAAARAAEISKSLNPNGIVAEDKEADRKSRSPSTTRARSRSKSRSPVSYRLRRKSRSITPPRRYSRGYRSRSPVRSRHYSSYEHERRSYRDSRDDSGRSRRRDSGKSHDRHSPVSRRRRSKSGSPRARRSYRDDSDSPKRHRDSPSHRRRKSSRADSRSPEHHRGSRSSPRNDESKGKHRKRSRSRSAEVNRNSGARMDESREEKSKHKERRRSRSSSEGKMREEKSKHKEMRRSRSSSTEDKIRKRSRLSPRVSGETKSKHKRRSRSRSPEKRHHVSSKVDKNSEEKTKHHERRRSRSRSTEGKRYKSSGMSPRRSDERKTKHRKRSRSRSSEHKYHSSDSGPQERKHENVKHLKERSTESDDSSMEPSPKDLNDSGNDDGHMEINKRDERDYERTEATVTELNLTKET